MKTQILTNKKGHPVVATFRKINVDIANPAMQVVHRDHTQAVITSNILHNAVKLATREVARAYAGDLRKVCEKFQTNVKPATPVKSESGSWAVGLNHGKTLSLTNN